MESDILKVENLSMRFGGIVALKAVNFSVIKGSITALIGPNGAGKTTLFNCLTGFYYPRGEMWFCPQNERLSIKKMLGEPFSLKHFVHPLSFLSCLFYKMFGGSHLITASGIVRTFQNVRLFREMTVIENCLVAQHMTSQRNLIAGLFNTPRFRKWEKEAIMLAYYWLDRVKLSHVANRLAGGLPLGLQRHLEIARAMCTQPSLLCLDEPAGGLNQYETNELSNLILSLREGSPPLSLILIEHDMTLVMKISDHIVVLDHGEVICQGSPQVVQNDPRVIEAYLGVDHKVLA